MKRHASQPKLNVDNSLAIPPLPTKNDYQKMPDSPNHGNITPLYDQAKQEPQVHHRGLWQTLMSLMTCGMH